MPVALELAKKGYAPGAASRNWASYGNSVVLPEDMPDWQKNLLCDPQTSGGLLVSCTPEAAEEVLELFQKQGFEYAAIVGKLKSGESTVSII